MNGFDSRILSLEQATDFFLHNTDAPKKNSVQEGMSFQDILTKTSENVKFSKHANMRLESRNITLSDTQMVRLNQGISQARGKSINESLVMMDNLAFIVNVKNNTVITALEQGEDGNVFTNIDGAVIV